MSKVTLLDSLRCKDYEEEYREWAIVEGILWSNSTRVLLRKEVQTCLAKSIVSGALQWIHEVKGHPSPEQWLNSSRSPLTHSFLRRV